MDSTTRYERLWTGTDACVVPARPGIPATAATTVEHGIAHAFLAGVPMQAAVPAPRIGGLVSPMADHKCRDASVPGRRGST
ncbi:hypothetical protein [Pseudonocardia phyllosphaerae]|uniref:hypothetical protein n=1 Tax=Pseudonocardia phyllosphaerae TaxID=3390502 RepID=UPI0039781D45